MSIPFVVMIPVGEQRPNKRNAWTNSKEQIGVIANGVQQFGWTIRSSPMKTVGPSQISTGGKLT
jgi:hypothetical protein